jgi:hypothetical protein
VSLLLTAITPSLNKKRAAILGDISSGAVITLSNTALVQQNKYLVKKEDVILSFKGSPYMEC